MHEAGRLGCGRLGCFGRSISVGALPTAEYIDSYFVLMSCSRVVVRSTVKES